MFNSRTVPSKWEVRAPTPQNVLIRSVESNSNDVTTTFELPNIKLEDFTVDLRQNRLTVSGESTATDTREGEGYAIRERRSAQFPRTLQIPFGTKAEDEKAKMENGILTVFPKSTPEQEPHRIVIQ